MKMEKGEQKNRKTWTNQVEYILSLFGCTTGFGDFWRFPYMAWRNGGGAFVLVFICALIFCGIPLYFMELVVSQYSGKGIYGVWDICPLFKGVGISICILNIVFWGYGSLTRYWLIDYMITSFTGLPWTSCNNTWNTNSCISRDIAADQYWNDSITNDEITTRSGNTTMSSEEEFWQYKVLDMSDGINEIGDFRWNLCLYALVYRLVVAIVVIKSVKSIGKAMYIFTVIPLILIIAMWIRVMLLPGAIDGVKLFLIPDFSKLTSIQVWIEAIMMAFYGLGPVWGQLFVVGSHSKFNNNCVRAAVIGCSTDGFLSVFCSILLFSVYGVAAKQSGFELGQTVKAGMSIGLVGYSKALSHLPLSQVWTIMFFVCVVVSTMDVTVMALEMMISFFQELLPNKLRNRRMSLTVGISILIFSMNLPFCTQGGPYMVQILDWYHGTLPLLAIAVLECLTFMWIYGGDKMDKVLRMMIGRHIPHIIRVSVAIILPLLLVAMLVVSLMKYKPPTYGTYIYPSYVEVIGWLLVLATMLPVPIYILCRYVKQHGSFKKRFAALMKPCDVWMLKGDNSKIYRKRTFMDSLQYNLMGSRSRQIDTFEINEMIEIIK